MFVLATQLDCQHNRGYSLLGHYPRKHCAIVLNTAWFNTQTLNIADSILNSNNVVVTRKTAWQSLAEKVTLASSDFTCPFLSFNIVRIQ